MIRAFNSAAYACVRAGQPERATRLLSEAQRKGLSLTRASFATMLVRERGREG